MCALRNALLALGAVVAISTTLPAQDGRAEQRVNEFFDALLRERWMQAAQLIHPERLDSFQDGQVSWLIALVQRHEALRKAGRAPRPGHEYEVSYSNVLSPEALAQYSSETIDGMGDARTIGAAHDLPAAEFMAHWLADRAKDTDSVSRRHTAWVPRTIIGEIIEADSIAHVLYRVPQAVARWGNPSDIEIMRLRRHDGRWYLWPESTNVDFRRGASAFIRHQLPVERLRKPGRDQ